jgi:hypothetical protein
MVSNDDNLVRDSTVDNSNDVPLWRGNIFLVIEKVENNIVGRRTNEIFDSFIAQAVVDTPVLVQISALGPVAIQRLEDGQGIRIGDRNTGDAWDGIVRRCPGCIGFRRPSWGGPNSC